MGGIWNTGEDKDATYKYELKKKQGVTSIKERTKGEQIRKVNGNIRHRGRHTSHDTSTCTQTKT